jgi:tartrate dehydrogenase/decarboxylase/D-malate dehydrogenase
MLEHFGLHDAAKSVHRAIEATTGAGTLTRDVGGDADTTAVTDAIIANLG